MKPHELNERVKYLEGLVEKQNAEINRLNVELNGMLNTSPWELILEKYHQKEAMMNTIMENVTVAITMMDYNGYFIFFNKQAEQHLRFPVEDLKNKPISELFPEQGPATLASVRQIFRDKKPIVSEVSYIIEGKETLFEIHRMPLLNSDGEVYSVLSISRDISEQIVSQKLSEIYHAIDSLQSIGETFHDSLQILFDNLFKFSWMDAGGLYLVDYDKETLDLVYHRGLSGDFAKKTSVYSFNSNNAKVAFDKVPRYVTLDKYLTSSKEDIQEERITFIATLPLVHQDKVLGLLNLASRKVTDIGQKEKHALEVIALKVANLIELIKTREKLDRSNAELTDRLKELSINQQMLIQKSRLESLGELSAGLAHEINQPLSVMSLVMENIHYKLGTMAASPEYLQKKFNTISQNINKIRALIDHMRLFSRDQGTIMFEQVDVNQVIKNALSMIGSQLRNRQVAIITQLEEGIGYTLGNPSRLEQVILNLISNARDAVEEKAQKNSNEDYIMEILVRTYSEKNKLFLVVRDNGTGISNENLERIFNPFFTTKSEGYGTGLGLPIVYGIIREMKGEITARSETGTFTEITIMLPGYKKNSAG
jgi:PAS domain S-box-containing protein